MNNTKSAELICVGTELLLGEIVNLDAQFISQGLSALGIDTFFHTVVGDNPKRLENAVNVAKSRADIIITTGGLGPTFDDLTKETLAKIFNRNLVLHQESLDKIVSFFRKMEHPMTENNKKQAMLPENCHILVNDWGTAPACIFEEGKWTIVMLPGPPSECQPLFENKAMKYLAKFSRGTISSKFIRLFGIGESEVESILHDKMENMTNPTIAPYAKEGECMIRVTAKAQDEKSAEKMLAPTVNDICRILGNKVYGINVNSLEEVVILALIEKGLTLSCAESCTGGLVSKHITDISGASKCFKGSIIAYSNQVKNEILGVDLQILKTYGAVSEETAKEMARCVAEKIGTDIGLSITGIAGPDGGSEEKPVGLVYIGLYYDGQTFVKKLNAGLDRTRIRLASTLNALNLIRTSIL